MSAGKSIVVFLVAIGCQAVARAQAPTTGGASGGKPAGSSYSKAIQSERQRLSKLLEGRDYPKGQGLFIWSDDIEAVKRERAATVRIVGADANGARKTVDQAKVSDQVQRQIDAAKLDKQIRDLTTTVQDARQEVYRLRKERAEVADKEGQPDSFWASSLSNARSSLRSAESALGRARDKWTSEINTACTDHLTYEACQCRNGALSKGWVRRDLESAESSYDRAKERLQDVEEKYEEDKARDKQKKLDDLDRRLSGAEGRLKDGDGRLKDLQGRRERLSAQMEAATRDKPAAPGGFSPRIMFDDTPKKAAPRAPAVKFDQFPR